MKRFLSLFCFLFFILAARNVCAGVETTASLLPGVQHIAASRDFYVILKLDIANGRHVYWKYAGDAGEPVGLSLKLPRGFVESGRLWSPPERFTTGPFGEYGYAGEMFLAVKITPPRDVVIGRDYVIDADVSWMSCKDDCVPESQKVSALVQGASAAPQIPEKVAEILEKMPVYAESVFWQKNGEILLAVETGDFFKTAAAAFFPNGDMISNTAPQKFVFHKGRLYLTLRSNGGEARELAGTVVLRNARGDVQKAFETQAVAANEPMPVFASPFDWQTLASAVLLAFLGGILLNFMPCVFPVLSLKALSVLKSDGADRRRDAVAYALGVVLSFAFLGALMSVLRAAGHGIGWGFQMQYPPFVLFMAVLLFVVGLMLSGVFDFGGALSAKAAQCGQNWGGFGTGLLAVLVATPCAAPFMAVALGYALTADTAETLCVFVTMGFGMALPFFMIGFFPSCAAKLPKFKGESAVLLRRFLAFPMYAASAWLVWVAGLQGGAYASGLTLAVMIAAALCAQIAGAFPSKKILTGGALICFCAFFAWSLTRVETDREARRVVQNAVWQAYDAQEIARLRREGVPVFVKFSASWCLTCLMNEKTTLENEDVLSLFDDKGVSLFFADWTNADDSIAAVLETFGRGGVPLYLYYAPQADEPAVLPQILTPAAIRGALKDL